MSNVIEIKNKYITKPGELGSPFNHDDGVGLSGESTDKKLYVSNCIVDLSNTPLENQDENCALTRGSSATFRRCILKNTGKLFLIGCGDDEWVEKERGKKVILENCILEHFGRRGPEVQDEMICEINNCLIRYWADPKYFTVRGFAGWAHKGGEIHCQGSIFIPYDKSDIPLKQRLLDKIYHISQAYNDEGIKTIFQRKTWIAGYRRALFATRGGSVEARNCWFDDDCYTDSNINPMSEYEFETRMIQFNKMETELKINLNVI